MIAVSADAIDTLDPAVFDRLPSQTTGDDRRSLLAVQRAVARHFGTYCYLEIGSHLGGSIQPHLLDPRCRRIYSIDPRPECQPDNRGFQCHYPDNSTTRMLNNLRELAPDRVDRIATFDLASTAVDTRRITERPNLCFIDGEHTTAAVLADADFCLRVGTPDSAIVFHDAPVVWRAVRRVLRQLKRRGTDAEALVLGGTVLAIALGASPLRTDRAVLAMRRSTARYFVRSLAYDLYRRGRRLMRPPASSAPSAPAGSGAATPPPTSR